MRISEKSLASNARARISYAVLVLTTLCAAIYIVLANAAGCAGDVKSGLGDPAKALELENLSLVPYMLAVPTGVFGILVHPRIRKVVPILCLFMCVLPLLWWFGAKVEVAGILRCGSAQ
jgi:hypothetical protein